MAHPTLNQKQGTIVNVVALGLLALGAIAAINNPMMMPRAKLIAAGPRPVPALRRLTRRASSMPIANRAIGWLMAAITVNSAVAALRRLIRKLLKIWNWLSPSICTQHVGWKRRRLSSMAFI